MKHVGGEEGKENNKSQNESMKILIKHKLI